MISKFKAAVFDMDGTLLDSMRFWRFTTLEYLLQHNVPVRKEDLVIMQDSSSRKLIPKIYEEMGLELDRENLVPWLENRMDLHYQVDVSPKPFAKEYLEKLFAQGVRMCVATAAPREVAARAIAKHDMLKNFEFVTDSHEYGMRKDDPRFFHIMAEKLGVKIDELCVFEDALYAIEGAKAAGCQVCAIEDITARLQKDEIMRLADVYVKGYEELI